MADMRTVAVNGKFREALDKQITDDLDKIMMKEGSDQKVVSNSEAKSETEPIKATDSEDATDHMDITDTDRGQTKDAKDANEENAKEINDELADSKPALVLLRMMKMKIRLHLLNPI